MQSVCFSTERFFTGPISRLTGDGILRVFEPQEEVSSSVPYFYGSPTVIRRGRTPADTVLKDSFYLCLAARMILFISLGYHQPNGGPTENRTPN